MLVPCAEDERRFNERQDPAKEKAMFSHRLRKKDERKRR
jgi:hypothetical protein